MGTRTQVRCSGHKPSAQRKDSKASCPRVWSTKEVPSTTSSLVLKPLPILRGSEGLLGCLRSRSAAICSVESKSESLAHGSLRMSPNGEHRQRSNVALSLNPSRRRRHMTRTRVFSECNAIISPLEDRQEALSVVETSASVVQGETC